MESVLWNILQFNPNARNISLVSTDWQRNVSENTSLVLEGVKRTYPTDSLHDSMVKAIMVDDTDTIVKAISIQTYAPINWDDLSRYLRSGRMADLISRRISVNAEIEMRDRLSKNGIDRSDIDLSIQRDDPRVYLKLFHLMTESYCPQYEPYDLIEQVIDTFGMGKIPLSVRICLSNMGIISQYEVDAPFDEPPLCNDIMSSQDVSNLILDIYQGGVSYERGFAKIRDMLSYTQCITADTVSVILRYVAPNPGIENLIRGRALSIAMINGWDHILDKYLTVNNILMSISNILIEHQISSRTWKYLEYANMNPSWFQYYANMKTRPEDIDPTLWRKLLANAVVNGNIQLVQSIASKHRNRIDQTMELNILQLSRQHGTYSVALMNALKE